MNTKLCIACDTALPVAAEALFEIPTIISDCRPWKNGRSVALCNACGLMERVVRPEAVSSFGGLYENYSMFSHSAAASDQMNFNGEGIAQGRTQKILSFIAPKLSTPPMSILDIGSGSGAGLIALAQQFAAASIDGFEPNDHPAERQKHLPANVISIYNRRPDAKGTYDFISLFHVFEHIEDLGELLTYIQGALSPHGNVLIQVPYVNYGAFDLIIADHIWHFTQQSLLLLLQKAGFHVTYIGNDVIAKEITLLATPGLQLTPAINDQNETTEAKNAIKWLVDYNDFLTKIKNQVPLLAVYGTGPAAAWAGHILGECVHAYLDDDPARINSTFNGKPVIAPGDLDAALPVIAPFPDYQAQWILSRNSNLNIIPYKSGVLCVENNLSVSA